MTPLTSTWVLILPELGLLTALNILLVYGAVVTTRPPYVPGGNPMRLWCLWTLALTLGLLTQEGSAGVSLFEGAWSYTPEIRTLQGVVLALAIGALALGGRSYRLSRVNAFEWPLLVLCVTWGLLGLMTAQSFLSFYLMLEIQSFALYLLAASQRGSAFSTESALKYFILGALASGFLLFGAALCYGTTGTLLWSEMALLNAAISAGPAGGWVALGLHLPYSVGVLFVLVGLLFKLSAFPFHVWTPDVYEGAPTWVTATMALLPKLAMGLATIRFLISAVPGYTVGYHAELDSSDGTWVFLMPLLMVVAAGSLLVGAFGALSQRTLKRLLAFSTINHVGYALVGLSVGTREGFQSALFAFLVYSIMTLGAFALLLGFRQRSLADPVSGPDGLAPSLQGAYGVYTADAPTSERGWHEVHLYGSSRSQGVHMKGQPESSSLYSVSGMSGPNHPMVEAQSLQGGVEWNDVGRFQPVRMISDLAGLGRTHPALGVAWVVVLFALAGIPPFAGFWSKYAVFSAALASGSVGLAILAVMTSVVSVFYYLRLVKTLYYPTAAEMASTTMTGVTLFDSTNARILAIGVVILTLFTLDPSGILAYTDRIMAALLASTPV